MYGIMVVDDDAIVRTTIKCIVDWKRYGFQITGEAANGRQALKRMKDIQVDILITDINMPVMDGLDLIREMLKRSTPPQILVLSAYDEYNLVREAFKLGVQDYLLKDDIDSESLLQNVQTLAGRLDGFAVPPVIPPDPSGCLRTLAASGGKAGELLVPFMEGGYCLVCFEVEDYRRIALRFGDGIEKSFVAPVCDIAAQETAENRCVFAVPEPGSFVLLVSGGTDFARKQAYKLASAWRRYLNLRVTAAVSSEECDPSRFTALYRRTREDIDACYVRGHCRIFLPEDRDKFDVSQAAEPSNEIVRLTDALFSDREALKQILPSYLERLSAQEPAEQMSRALCLIYHIVKKLEDAGEKVETIFGHEADFYQLLHGLNPGEDLAVWIRNFFDWTADYLHHRYIQKESGLIIKAQKFIRENYMDVNISLKLAADYVGLSEKYFSTLFAQQTGCTFTDFLTKTRIAQAKKLFAETNDKVYEIAYAVGYSSVEHFSRSFKKIEGMSPSEYRK